MKAFCKICLLAIGLLLLSTSAVATDYRQHGGLSFSFGSHGNHIRFGYADKHYDHSSHHIYRYRHHYSHKPYHSYKYRYSPFWGYRSFGYKQPRYNHNRYNRDIVKKPCHPVTKVIVDRHGQYRGIAGTMCYDRYGNGYVVKGSRYSRH
ncbi:hypothetical protein A9Q79_09850 [Methylophaga sp. 42_25_T18]|nr:hypothetical protein A9Q79_09850 [Methylophaga sp. 42_25_T18]OUR89941.1 hypothetical protein A9Q92_00055 [Methylophaga sp. 42_8_T64]